MLTKMAKCLFPVSTSFRWKSVSSRNSPVTTRDNRGRDDRRLGQQEVREFTEEELNPFAFDKVYDENESFQHRNKRIVQRQWKEKKFFHKHYAGGEESPSNVLTREERELVRQIYSADPDPAKLEDLSMQFGVENRIIKKIVKNKVRPRLSYPEMKQMITDNLPKGEFTELVTRFSVESKPVPLLEAKSHKPKDSRPAEDSRDLKLRRKPESAPPQVKRRDKEHDLQTDMPRVPVEIPFRIDQKEGYDEAYMYSTKRGYEYPYGLKSERGRENIRTPTDSDNRDGRITQRADGFYDAVTGEFLYRVPGLDGDYEPR